MDAREQAAFTPLLLVYIRIVMPAEEHAVQFQADHGVLDGARLHAEAMREVGDRRRAFHFHAAAQQVGQRVLQ